MTTKIRPSTLENTAVSAGTYGGASAIPSFTVDAQGRLSFSENVTSGVVTAGSRGDSISVPAIVYNALGQITAATNTTIRSATTSQTGVVQLTDSTSSTSTTTAATPNSVKTVNDSLTTEISNRQANVGAGLIATTSSITSAYQANTGAALIAAKSYTTSQGYLTSVGTSDITNGAITAAKLDGAQSGSAPIFGVRAWANFVGNGADGSATINASGNISSITKNSTGTYTCYFSTAMPDANYAVSISAGPTVITREAVLARTTTYVQFATYNATDPISLATVMFMVVR